MEKPSTEKAKARKSTRTSGTGAEDGFFNTVGNKIKKNAPRVLKMGGLILFGSGVIGATGCGNGDMIGSDYDPNEFSDNPTTTTAVETTPTTGQQERLTLDDIKVDPKLLDDPNALVETFIDDRLTDWMNAGANHANAQAALDSGDLAAFAAVVAAETDGLYARALFGDNWENDPEVADWVENIMANHRWTLEAYFATSFPNIYPQDIAPFRQEAYSVGASEIVKINGKTIRITYDVGAKGNPEDNRVGESLTGGSTIFDDENIANHIDTYSVVDDRVIITGVSTTPK